MATFLRALLDDDVMRAAALRAMASLDDEMTPTVILKRYKSFSADEKRDAVSILASRTAFARTSVSSIIWLPQIQSEQTK